MDSISAIPQQPQLGRLAQFLRYLETQNAPEFLPKQLDVMGLMRQLALPQASTVENLSYGNLPLTMPPQGTGAMIPQVKTGRKPEVADLISTFSGVPGLGAISDVGTKLSNDAADALVRAITRNPQATAPQVLQETAMPFMNAVAPKTTGLLETPAKSDLGFYSALEQATIPLQNKGTGSQYLAQIEKTAGVKPEEIKWTGLDEFLKSKPNVTKQEVQDYLAANRVNLQEVRLGGELPAGWNVQQNPRTGLFDAIDPQGNVMGVGQNRAEAIADASSEIVLSGMPTTAPTKFSSYTLPGGENYREILLTLPETNVARQAKIDAINEQYNAVLAGRAIADLPPSEKAIIDRLTREHDAIADAPIGQDFRSSHFDQPNILAHMRVNDRVVDGKKTLFIEEIQSDWHQAGRKYGYSNPQAREQVARDIKDRYGFTIDENTSIAKLEKAGVDPETVNRWHQLVLNDVERVPNAPFKTTWHELSLKRAIQEASEKGYDRIAFTTGKTQAERYDLSKQVDSLLYSKNPDGTYRVSAQVQGRGQIMGEAIPESDLADYVGKEVAEKMTKGVGKKTEVQGKPIPGQWSTPKEYMTELSGEGLKVGGEGMKGFYDNILPKSLDKLGKKFDAKVGKTTMDGVEVWSMDITPKMRESVLTKGQPLFAATPAVPLGLLGGDEGE